MILLHNSIILTALQDPPGDAFLPCWPGQTPAQQMIGDFAPKLVELTDEVLFGDVWARPELSPRDRSLVTCAALVTNGSIEQLRGHLGRARRTGSAKPS